MNKAQMTAKPEHSMIIRLTTQLEHFTLDLDLTLPAQGVTGFYGHSGCGKTTLLRCLAGLHMADGSFQVNDHVWQQNTLFIPPHKRALAYVFQEPGLFPHLSVRQNIEYGFKRIAKEKRKISIEQCVQWLNLSPLLDRMPGKLSGGEKQRVAIARALATSPELLLMDEPLSALDGNSKNEILHYLERLHVELSIPVIYVSHSLDEIARLADHLVILEQGTVVASGKLTDVMARPNLPIRQQDDEGVVIPAEIIERDASWHLIKARFEGGYLWLKDQGEKVGSDVRLRLLSRDISLSLSPHADHSILNTLAAEVVDITPSKHPAVLTVKVNIGKTPILARLTARSVDALNLKNGKQVWIQVKSVAVIE